MKLTPWSLILALIFLTACTSVNLDASIPTYDTGIDPETWAVIPAGEFFSGQFSEPVNISYEYDIMVTHVTVAQYVSFLNLATADGTLIFDKDKIVGFY